MKITCRNSTRLALPGHGFRLRGFSLPVVLLFSALLLLMIMAEAAQVHYSLSSRSDRERGLKAQYAAQAGLNRALQQLSADSNWAPAIFSGVLQGDPSLGFEVEVLNNHSQAVSVPAPDGGTVAPGAVWLRSTGTVDGRKFKGSLGQAKAMPVKPQPIFNYLLYEHQLLIFSPVDWPRNFMDSYSGLPTGYTQTVVPGNPSTYQNRATIRSDDEVAIRDGFVDASVEVPTFDADLCDPARVSGTRTSNSLRMPVWKFKIPAAMKSVVAGAAPSAGTVAPGRYTSLSVPSNGSITLQNGEYYFDSIFLGDHATLNLSGASDTDPCVVYIGNSFEASSYAEINMALEPRKLQLYSTDQAGGRTRFLYRDYVKISATVAGYGAMITLGNFDDLFGAYRVFDFAEGADSKLHYDTSLKNEILNGDPEWVLNQEVRE